MGSIVRRTLWFDRYALDLARGSLRSADREIELRPKAFKVLKHLVENVGRLVAKDELHQVVWRDVIVTDDSLVQCIGQLRQALDDREHRLIKTVSRRGYLLDTEVHDHDPSKAVTGGTCGFKDLGGAFGELVAPPHQATPSNIREGERKLVTVLYADIKESLEICAEHDPEEALNVFEAVLKLMTQAIHKWDGTVNLVLADGLFALFGAPLAHEDHAVRACLAALEIQRIVELHAGELSRATVRPLRVRFGLNSGEVAIRPIDSGRQIETRAMSPTLHAASRIGQRALPGQLLISRETWRLTEGHFEVKAIPPVEDNAGDGPIFELVAAGPARTRFMARAAHGLTRFIGRNAQLEQLHRLQQFAGKGRGQVVAVVGEAGVGKSRLAYELVHSPSTEGWLVLACGAASYGQTMSYLPVINLLKGYFDIHDQDSLDVVRDKVTAKLLALDRALAPTLPALLALLDVPVDDPSWQALDPRQRRRCMLDAGRYLLLRQARERQLLLIFEDLHWIDSETQALLDSLVESLGSSRILLLVTYRPEHRHGWGGKTCYSQSRLDALATEGAGRLLDALLGEHASLARLKRLLVKRGNPFFLEETVRTLVETKALEGSPGLFRLTRPVETLQLPATVQVILAARIDRLSPEDKRLLQVAAVVGRSVSFSLLQAITGLPEETLRKALDRLQAAELVHEVGLPPDVEHRFKHALTQEVAYGSMLQDRRRELHARIVEVIEALHRDHLGEHVDVLAHHAQRGELPEKAVSYLFQAGEKAARRSAPRIAEGWYRQALDQVQTLPETRDKWEQAFAILDGMNGVLANLGETRSGAQCLRQADVFAGKLSDDRRRGRLLAMLASYCAMHGELDEAVVKGQCALAMAERTDNAALRIQTQAYLEQVHYYRADYEQVADLAAANLGTSAPDSPYYGASVPGPVFIRLFLIRSLAELGQFSDAASHAHEMIKLAESTQSPFAVGAAQLCSGWNLLAKGDWARAWPHFERGTAEYRKGSIVLALPHALASSAWILAQLGETGQALGYLREGEEFLTQGIARGTIDQAGMDYQWLGRAALLLGRLDDARRLADLSLQYSSSHPGFAAHALHLVGNIAAHPDWFDAEQGEAHYRKSLALAKQRAMRPLVAHCHFGLAKLYRRIGKRKSLRAHLNVATSLYRQMGMGFYVEQTESLAAQVLSP